MHALEGGWCLKILCRPHALVALYLQAVRHVVASVHVLGLVYSDVLHLSIQHERVLILLTIIERWVVQRFACCTVRLSKDASSPRAMQQACTVRSSTRFQTMQNAVVNFELLSGWFVFVQYFGFCLNMYSADALEVYQNELCLG